MAQELHVRLSGGYYFHTLTRLINDLQPILHLNERARVVVNLSDLTFIGPTAMALLLAGLMRLSEKDLWESGSMISAPRSKGLSTYLERMDFLRVFFEDPVPVPGVPKRTEGLLECQHFVDASDCATVARHLADTIMAKVTTDAGAQSGLYMCLSELTDNVYYHADTPLGGFAAAQAFRKSGEIEAGIVDLGVGIAGSLSKNPDYVDAAQDDLEAIKIALKPTITSTPLRNNGYGLTFTRLLLGLNGGRLVVRSGYGRVQYGERNVEKTDRSSIPGTIVALRLHTDRPFDTKAAWGLLWEAIESIVGALRDPKEPVMPS